MNRSPSTVYENAAAKSGCNRLNAPRDRGFFGPGGRFYTVRGVTDNNFLGEHRRRAGKF